MFVREICGLDDLYSVVFRMYDPEHVVAEELVEVDELWALMMNEEPDRRILLGHVISMKYANRLAGHIDAKWHTYLDPNIIFYKVRLAPSDLEHISDHGKWEYNIRQRNSIEGYHVTMDITTTDRLLSCNDSKQLTVVYDLWPCIRHRVQLEIKPLERNSEYVRTLYNLRKKWWPRIHIKLMANMYYLHVDSCSDGW
jgi:hypothetical protein